MSVGLLLLVPLLATSRAEPTIVADPATISIGTQVSPKGEIKSGGTSYLRLTLSDSKPSLAVVLIADDLRVIEDGQGQDLSRGHVKISPGALELKPGVPQDVAVASDVSIPGEYATVVHIRSESVALDIPVSIKVTRLAEPQFMPASLTGQRVHCNRGCWLANLVFPDSILDDTLTVSVEPGAVDAPVAVEPQGISLLLRGEHSGRVIEGGAVEATACNVSSADKPTEGAKPERCPSGKLGDVFLHLDPSQIGPDRYTGAVYIRFQGERMRRALPVELSVRQGPAIPAAVLAFAVFLGWVAGWVFGRGRSRVMAERELEAARRIAATSHTEDAAILGPQVANADQLLDAGELQGAEAEAKLIVVRAKALAQARLLKAQLDKYPPSERPGIEGKIQTLVNKVRAEAPATELAAAVQALREIPPPVPSGTELAEAADYVPRTSTTTRSILFRVADRTRAFTRRLLLPLASIGAPVLGVLALVAVMLLGIKEAYLDNATFGAQPFKDYVTLGLWGLGAWASKRAVTGLAPA